MHSALASRPPSPLSVRPQSVPSRRARSEAGRSPFLATVPDRIRQNRAGPADRVGKVTSDGNHHSDPHSLETQILTEVVNDPAFLRRRAVSRFVSGNRQGVLRTSAAPEEGLLGTHLQPARVVIHAFGLAAMAAITGLRVRQRALARSATQIIPLNAERDWLLIRAQSWATPRQGEQRPFSGATGE